jgi:zinc/manganese transport system substrate-binding protein
MSATIRRRAAALGCVAVLGGACSATTGSSTTAGARTRTLHIVVGENFWGSIVSQLSGAAGQVTSIVTDPNVDPHNFESSADNARAFADADYVVLNGAGYDGWADRLINGNPSPRRTVLTIAELLGKKDGDNPHFWYQPDYVARVADRVTADLKGIDPADATYFDAQRVAFTKALAPDQALLDALKARHGGAPVASTESIFVYLSDYLGLKLLSPVDFMNAVAEGNDPPAPSVATFHDLLTNKAVKVLVYNEQSATDVTTNLKTLATSHGIAIVGVTETVQPPDATFQGWFGAQLLRLQGALDASTPTGGS